MSIIFVSYSHQNSHIKDEFAKALGEQGLKEESVTFIDDDIENGTEWEIFVQSQEMWSEENYR